MTKTPKKLSITRDAETAPILDVITRAAAQCEVWSLWRRVDGVDRDLRSEVVQDLTWCTVGVCFAHPEGRVTIDPAFWLTKTQARALRDAIDQALVALETP